MEKKKIQKKDSSKKTDVSDIKISIKKSTIKQGAMILGAILLLALVVWGISNINFGSGSDEIVKLDFYVMSQCPYGTQVEDAIAPVLEKIGDNVDFNLEFIATENPDGSFSALHGQPEVLGNIVQLCAIEHEPESYMDMIVCMNKDARSIPNNWEACAEENDLSVELIKECYEGEEGKQLLSESSARSREIGASGSPTIYLNDKQYSGGRTEVDFFRALCNEFEDAPSACSDIPKPKEVNAIILNDERCETCDTSRLVTQLEGIFPGLEVEYLDYSDKAGKELYDKLGLEALPAILFDESVEEGEGYTSVQRYLQPKEDYQMLAIGSSFNPEMEICDNEIDDNGNGLVDCEDPECDGEFVCMVKMEVPQVELFVMSHCPYGTQAEKGILPVVELLGEKIDFELKFVDYAMHGKTELDEQLRQYCIQEEQNEVFIEYLTCFLGEGDSDACDAEVSVDTEMLDACIASADEEFKITELYLDQTTWQGGRFPQFNTHKEENDKYGISGSPGLAVNGVKIDSFGRSPANLLGVVCMGFEEEPAECSTQLSTATPSAGFGFETTSTTSTTAGCGV